MAELASTTSAPAATRSQASGAVKVALADDSFRHEALFYSGEDGFLCGALAFVRDGLLAGEPLVIAIAVADERAASLRHALGADAGRVAFLEMRELSRKPARLTPTWRLLCPYDLDALGRYAIEAARSTHRVLMHEGISCRNGACLPLDAAPRPFAGLLPAPPSDYEQLLFTGFGLSAVRSLVAASAAGAGLSVEAGEELVLAVNELATNSVQHGGGGGTLRVWTEHGAFVCEVRDRGFIRDPLAGRLAPLVEQFGGRGLWLVNQLCDLVQIRSAPSGTVVRVHALR